MATSASILHSETFVLQVSCLNHTTATPSFLYVAGTTERKIPVPTSNPMTAIFSFVSCPNYTYEVIPTAFAGLWSSVFLVGWSLAGVQPHDPVPAW